MDHTPTPYAVETGDTIIGSNGGIVAIAFDAKPAGTLRNKEQENANAAFIVRACNSHEALLAACDWVLRYAKNTPEGAQWMVSDPSGFRQFETAIAAARGDA